MGFGSGGSSTSSIAGASDATLNNPTNNEVLTYDGSTSMWKNAESNVGARILVFDSRDDFPVTPEEGVFYAHPVETPGSVADPVAVAAGVFASEGNATSGNITLTRAVAAGQTLVVIVAGGSTATLGVNDPKGNIWTQVATAVNTANGIATTTAFTTTVTNAYASGETIGVTRSNGTNSLLGVAVVAENATTTVLDTQTGFFDGGGNVDSPAVTVPSGGGLVITATGASNTLTYTATAPLTMVANENTTGGTNLRTLAVGQYNAPAGAFTPRINSPSGTAGRSMLTFVLGRAE